MDITVVICTHNPRPDYFDRVLNALQVQTLATDQWELLVVDNASSLSVAERIDVSWHPHSRCLHEPKLGLTPARLRGIEAAKGETIVFVDDDNVLAAAYLERTANIARRYPMMGAWGGRIVGEFEQAPPAWSKRYLPLLAIREITADKLSDVLPPHETTPCGAGLCVRRSVAERYARSVVQDAKRMSLDRQGKLLSSGGDTDLALVASDLGLGTGQFVALELTHLIPAVRLEEAYLLRLIECMGYSHMVLHSLRNPLPDRSLPRYLFHQLRALLMSPQDRKFFYAEHRGKNFALADLHSELGDIDIIKQKTYPTTQLSSRMTSNNV
ncbi:glycosyltransferase [Chamaesiphon sp. OTE_75_metabat_556]|uniref:glycosyltransferase n=1 Tax=Chamaesiphon sp. OTE_75_metabat_556 TaxID=2964692 RepID=UPI00286BD560|nr:glycosyltransferase [Chamaesiphon sp. OTE_75_metabat_556]